MARSWDELKSMASTKLQELHTARQMLKEEKRNQKKTREDLKAAREAQIIIQNLAADIQTKAHQRISAIVTRCLEVIFDEPYSFEITFSQKRGKTEANLYFVNSAGERIDPTTEAGGGVVDVAAFALRLAALALSTPKCRKLLVLDEPFKFLSDTGRVRILLESLAREMQLQIIMVSHDASLQCGKQVEL